MHILMLLRRIVTLAIVLSILVVMLGAYTRLTQAGLGCPDWPGCYGRMIVSSTDQGMIETTKAWTEMVHRYAAGILVLLIVFINGLLIYSRQSGERVQWQVPLALVGLVFFQAALGMWTVTLKLLPLVVMGHLLGGILIFSNLIYFRMQLSGLKRVKNNTWRILIGLGLVLVFCQIALGGWVSSNYAGLGCVGFPKCNGHWWPGLNFPEGFNFFMPIGANYQGGVLDSSARVTIQFVHRLGAFIVAMYIFILSAWIGCRVQFVPLRVAASLAVFLLLIQLMLGMLNVIYLLPLGVAVLHNGVAALLLALFFVMYYLVSGSERHASAF